MSYNTLHRQAQYIARIAMKHPVGVCVLAGRVLVLNLTDTKQREQWERTAATVPSLCVGVYGAGADQATIHDDLMAVK